MILLGAPAYYGARGFGAAGAFGMGQPFAGTTAEGFTIEEEDFQVAVLDDERASALEGTVRWHPAFG